MCKQSWTLVLSFLLWIPLAYFVLHFYESLNISKETASKVQIDKSGSLYEDSKRVENVIEQPVVLTNHQKTQQFPNDVATTASVPENSQNSKSNAVTTCSNSTD